MDSGHPSENPLAGNLERRISPAFMQFRQFRQNTVFFSSLLQFGSILEEGGAALAGKSLRVVLAESAWGDSEEIVSYWTDRGEQERGEQYARDLPREAIRQLSSIEGACGGRFLVQTAFPEMQELMVFRRSYRVLYRMGDVEGVVEVLRFWHSHRDEPFGEEGSV